MSKFTKYWPTEQALVCSPNKPSTYRADFVSWDVLSPRAVSTEATKAEDLGKTMSLFDIGIFSSLVPGQTLFVRDVVYALD